MKRAWDCEPRADGKPVLVPYFGTDWAIPLDRCPMRDVQKIGVILDLWQAWRRARIPPVAGGYLDQPAILFDAFNLLNFYCGLANDLMGIGR